MTTPKVPQRSPLGLLVLCQLSTGPMHAYRMQKLFEAQGKNRVVNVRSRATLYQALERLVRLGLVEVVETVRVEGYPDRVVYAITAPGRHVTHEWLREMLRSTGGEYPEFIAAVSVLFALTPAEAETELRLRADRLADGLADAESELAHAPEGLPRLFLLEEEYRRAVLSAELQWVRGVIADLHAGRMTWSEEWLREIAAAFADSSDENDPEES